MKTRDICIIGIFFVILGLAFYYLFYTHVEGFTFDTFPIPQSGQIPYGYYRIDETVMAKIPYGYTIDTTDTTYKKIVPIISTSFFAAKPIPIPISGISQGFYQVSPGFMAKLPDNMYASIQSVNSDGTFVYKNGYVNESDYFAAKFPMPTISDIPTLPSNCYLNIDKMTISILPYGKISNGIDTPGYIDNPDLISANGKFNYQSTQYKDIAGQYDTLFHEDEKALRDKQTAFQDAKTGYSIIDQDGNLVKLPRESVQGDLTFNDPKDYKYGASNYVPTYEDSVYLSRTTQLPVFSPFNSSSLQQGFCKAFEHDPASLDEKCRQLDTKSCAATSCCVLFGGSKCVAGNENGPTNASNYKDIFVRNKDYYYYQGKCYGNCYQATSLYNSIGDGGDNGVFDYNAVQHDSGHRNQDNDTGDDGPGYDNGNNGGDNYEEDCEGDDCGYDEEYCEEGDEECEAEEEEYCEEGDEDCEAEEEDITANAPAPGSNSLSPA